MLRVPEGFTPPRPSKPGSCPAMALGAPGCRSLWVVVCWARCSGETSSSPPSARPHAINALGTRVWKAPCTSPRAHGAHLPQPPHCASCAAELQGNLIKIRITGM